jgi:DNA-binding NtrC family response regulator
VRVLAESVLQEHCHTTLSANSPDQTIAILYSDEKVDLLFVDLTLHGDAEAGLHTAQQAIKRRSGLPALYTTGQGITDGMKAMFVQPFGFIPKPYTVEQLYVAIANLLEPKT